MDTIWGTGINGKVSEDLHKFEKLDVRAVRGPLTRNYLISKGINCPEVYGDLDYYYQISTRRVCYQRMVELMTLWSFRI